MYKRQELRDNCGLIAPGGINNCKLLKISNKSSGKPAGVGEIFFNGKENGTPNPGVAGPEAPPEGLMETSDEMCIRDRGSIYLSFGNLY